MNIFRNDYEMITGSHAHFPQYMSEPSGSSYVFEGFYEYIQTGHSHDHPKYDLWKCDGCGHVHKVGETLECTHCGHPITEKSRFILE
ncbi:MAG: hypothetical protein BV458_09920 [Thermoplasmata archaeon M9B2D]|nr:MAG: hypothetical protein BV458_09920 [Thermoplasmata archaeon M9B2D]